MARNMQISLDWASDEDLVTKGDVVRDIAAVARRDWRMPLRDYSIEVTNVVMDHEHGWPLVTLVGPDTNLRVLWHCYQQHCTMQQALKQGCYEAEWAVDEGILRPVG